MIDIEMTNFVNSKDNSVLHQHMCFEIIDNKIKQDTSSNRKLKHGHVIANEDILKKNEE